MDTAAAEDMAADYLDAHVKPPDLAARGLRPTEADGIWSFASEGTHVLALFQERRILEESASLIADGGSPQGVTVKLLSPFAGHSVGEPFLSIAAGEMLPGWQLALYLQGSDPFAAADKRQRTTYLWGGALAVAAIVILALLVARHVGRQMRLAQLKNDFVATVSHELKTPLTSMRVLVDTLLEGRYHDREQALEYCRLIAGQNERLSHLIDNFLTFSRMERNKRVFVFTDVEAAQIIGAAVGVARERCSPPNCHLDVEVEADLPPIIGDRDALVTVALSLLDNAQKYSEDGRHITVRAYAADKGTVCLEVEDDGIGMSHGVVKRIFDRFYQVDQRLSRRAGGCGLGLSIVKFIVDAHGGRIDVDSQVGRGSRFTVHLPAAADVPTGNAS